MDGYLYMVREGSMTMRVFKSFGDALERFNYVSTQLNQDDIELYKIDINTSDTTLCSCLHYHKGHYVEQLEDAITSLYKKVQSF